MLAVTLVSGAYGAAPSSEKATIKTDGFACSVLATFQWKNITNGSYPTIEIYPEYGSRVAQNIGPASVESSGTISVSLESGQNMARYYAVGIITGGVGVATSRTVTLRCRG